MGIREKSDLEKTYPLETINGSDGTDDKSDRNLDGVKSTIKINEFL